MVTEVLVLHRRYHQSKLFKVLIVKVNCMFDHKKDEYFVYSATLVFEVELVACRPRKGSSLSSVSDEKARLL